MKKIRIGVPNNHIYSGLINNNEDCKKNRDIEVFRLPENQVSSLFADNRFDMALLTPLGLGRIFTKSDFRIVPTRILASNSFTGLASINIAGNLRNIHELMVPETSDYWVQIAQILLSERYGIFPKIKSYKNAVELLEGSCSFVYNHQNLSGQLDVSEDWFETYEIPLIYGLWIVRNEEEPENLIEIIEEIAGKGIENEIQIIDEKYADYDRRGSIITKWDLDMEESLEQIYQLLFFRQLIDKLPSIKLLNI